MTHTDLLRQSLDELKTKYSDYIYDGAGSAIAGAFEDDVAALRAALARPTEDAQLDQQREAFEAWYWRSASVAHGDLWAAWQAATRHAAQLALDAPIKTARQDQREACANWILGGME